MRLAITALGLPAGRAVFEDSHNFLAELAGQPKNLCYSLAPSQFRQFLNREAKQAQQATRQAIRKETYPGLPRSSQ
jgi:hypothetical protein